MYVNHFTCITASLILFALNFPLVLSNPLRSQKSSFDRPGYSAPFPLSPQAFVFKLFDHENGSKALLASFGDNPLRQTIERSFTDREWALVTVLKIPEDCRQTPSQVIASYRGLDDVWSEEFLEITLLRAHECDKSWKAAPPKGSNLRDLPFFQLKIEEAIPEGPYLVHTLRPSRSILHPIYRIYDDSQYAFTTGVLPSSEIQEKSRNHRFSVSMTGSTDGRSMSTLGIPVPSRLYFRERKESTTPLAGLRVAVKDLFDVAGIRSGCGNRAYHDFNKPASHNSDVVSKLLDLGAVIIGKTKLSQFANGEVPTADWVDQICPFNPRGDGYQDPSSSSSGAAVAEASYEWLDISIGSDTGGSVRGPAGVNGLLGVRPSTGAISLKGAMPMSDVQDTVGYFARDARLFREVGKHLYNLSEGSLSPVDRIQVPSDLWSDTQLFGKDDERVQIFNDFIGLLTSITGAQSIDREAFEGKWNVSDISGGKDLRTYTNYTYPTLIGKYQYRQFAKPFIDSFRQATGRDPYIDPVPRTRWAWAEAQGNNSYEDALIQRSNFEKFVQSIIVPPDCSSILVYPQSVGRPSYRDQYLKEPLPPYGFYPLNIANFAAVPEIVMPIGQISFNSSVTHSDVDSLPLAISVVGGRGCDLQLLDLAARLQTVGYTRLIQAGRNTFGQTQGAFSVSKQS